MSCVILLSGRSLWTIQLPIMGTRFFASLRRSCHVIHSGIWMCGCDTIICFCPSTIGEKCVSSYVGWNVSLLKMPFLRSLPRPWSAVTNRIVYSDLKSVNMCHCCDFKKSSPHYSCIRMRKLEISRGLEPLWLGGGWNRPPTLDDSVSKPTRSH